MFVKIIRFVNFDPACQPAYRGGERSRRRIKIVEIAPDLRVFAVEPRPNANVRTARVYR
jgi:hypothetical protein